MHRMDIYQPTPGKFYPFEIAVTLHEIQRAPHFHVLVKLMKYRTLYFSFSFSSGTAITNSMLRYENENEILDVNVRIRLSRKRNRKSK